MPAPSVECLKQQIESGMLDIASAGKLSLAVHPVVDGWQPMKLKSIILTPVK